MRAFLACRRWRRAFPQALWGELDAPRRAALDAHLAGCERCAAELVELRATLALVTGLEPQAASPRFAHLWDRLQPELDRVDRVERDDRGDVGDRRRAASRVALWATGVLAAAALFALGVLAGRVTWRPAPPAAPEAAELGERVAALEARLDRYLERATPILLAISNRTPAEAKAAVETGPERALALELAVEAAALREDLHGLRHGRGPRLVDNLERIFLQVANLPDGEYAEGMALVRSTLERQAILLEMSLQRLRGEPSRERPQA
jgi:anti-sigma factor RsiW